MSDLTEWLRNYRVKANLSLAEDGKLLQILSILGAKDELQARIAELENEVRLQKSNAGGAYERIAELDAALGKIIEAYGIHDYCSIVARKARRGE